MQYTIGRVLIEQVSPKQYSLTMTGKFWINSGSHFRKAVLELSRRLHITDNIRLVCFGKYALAEVIKGE